MKKILLFGLGKVAEIALYYLRRRNEYEVVALTVDKQYADKTSQWDLPIVLFENVEDLYPSTHYSMFVALGYQDLNYLRERKCKESKSKGYSLVSCIGNSNSIPTDLIYGENCFIMDNTLIHPCVQIGTNNFIWSGVMIGHHSKIGDNCWFTSSSQVAGGVTMGNHCFLSINATIGNQITVGNNCFFGANSLVTKCAGNDKVYLDQSTHPHRLTSKQFLKMTGFDYK